MMYLGQDGTPRPAPAPTPTDTPLVTSSRLTNALVFAGIIVGIRLLWNWGKRGSPFNFGMTGKNRKR